MQVIFLYPVYDRLRRMADDNWRRLTIAVSVIGGMLALTILAGRQAALIITDGIVLPILIAFTTLLEICAFTFIYGESYYYVFY